MDILLWQIWFNYSGSVICLLYTTIKKLELSYYTISSLLTIAILLSLPQLRKLNVSLNTEASIFLLTYYLFSIINVCHVLQSFLSKSYFSPERLLFNNWENQDETRIGVSLFHSLNMTYNAFFLSLFCKCMALYFSSSMGQMWTPS